MRRARAWRTALVSASCAMPMISRSTPPPNGGSSSTVELDRDVGGAPREVGHALQRRARHPRPRRVCGRSAHDRSARFDHVRAREIDRGLDAAARPRGGSVAADALRGLQLHQDRGEALRQRVVDVARDAGCALRAPPGAALRGGSARPAGSDAAPASPAAPSPRAAPGARRSRRRRASASTARPSRGCASAAPAARRAPTRCRSTRLNARTALGQARDRRRRSRSSRSSPACRRAGAPPCSRAAAPASSQSSAVLA